MDPPLTARFASHHASGRESLDNDFHEEAAGKSNPAAREVKQEDFEGD